MLAKQSEGSGVGEDQERTELASPLRLDFDFVATVAALAEVVVGLLGSLHRRADSMVQPQSGGTKCQGHSRILAVVVRIRILAGRRVHHQWELAYAWPFHP